MPTIREDDTKSLAPDANMRVIVVRAPEIDEEAITFSLLSAPFIPFWVMNVSFFLLFVSFNAVQNLVSMFYNDLGPLSLALVYAFFVPSNFTGPAWIETFLNGDSTVSMFIGSVFYTLFVASMIFGTYATAIPAAVLVGAAGGFLWVAQGTYLSRLSGQIARTLVEVEMQRHTSETHVSCSSESAVSFVAFASPTASDGAQSVNTPGYSVAISAQASPLPNEPGTPGFAPIPLLDSSCVGGASSAAFSAVEVADALSDATALAGTYADVDNSGPAFNPPSLPLVPSAISRFPVAGTPVVAATSGGLVPAVVLAASESQVLSAPGGPDLDPTRNHAMGTPASGAAAALSTSEPPVLVLLPLPALPVAAPLYVTDSTPHLAPAPAAAPPSGLIAAAASADEVVPFILSGPGSRRTSEAPHPRFRHTAASASPLVEAARTGSATPSSRSQQTLNHHSRASPRVSASPIVSAAPSPFLSAAASDQASDEAPAAPPKAPTTSTKLSSRVLARMLGVAWSTQMMTSICSSLIAIGMLSGTSSDLVPRSTVMLLFSVFTFVGIVANGVFFLLRRFRGIVAAPPDADGTAPPKTLREMLTLAMSRVGAVAARRVTIHLVPAFVATGMGAGFNATIVSARFAKTLVTPSKVPVVVIMFALTSMCVSTLYARRLTSLHVTRRAIFAAMVCQGVSLALAFTQDYRSPAWLADVGSAQAWLLCCVLAALQGLVDALSINASNATISIQYEQALVPGGFAMSMAMRGLGQFLMFLAAALIGYDFQRVMFAIIVSAALFSMIVLLHSRNEARLSEQLSWTALVQDAKSAPKAIPEAIVADFEALKAALGRCRRRGVYQEYSDEADG